MVRPSDRICECRFREFFLSGPLDHFWSSWFCWQVAARCQLPQRRSDQHSACRFPRRASSPYRHPPLPEFCLRLLPWTRSYRRLPSARGMPQKPSRMLGRSLKRRIRHSRRCVCTPRPMRRSC
jgi:hypothetical protein